MEPRRAAIPQRIRIELGGSIYLGTATCYTNFNEGLPVMLNDTKILTYEVKVNKRGQIVIPKFFREVLGLASKDQLRMTLRKNGIIELQKIINNIPVDFSLKYDAELRENVLSAYQSLKRGEVDSGEELKRKLFSN